jgi:hypothetical protein
MAGNALSVVVSISTSADSPIGRATFADPARLQPYFNVFLAELSIDIWTISRIRHSLSGGKRELHREAV